MAMYSPAKAITRWNSHTRRGTLPTSGEALARDFSYSSARQRISVQHTSVREDRDLVVVVVVVVVAASMLCMCSVIKQRYGTHTPATPPAGSMGGCSRTSDGSRGCLGLVVIVRVIVMPTARLGLHITSIVHE